MTAKPRKPDTGKVEHATEQTRNDGPQSAAPASSPALLNAPDLRILLWDIDGTLIRSVRTGAYKDYTIPVLEEIFGTSGRLAKMRVSGMTDLQIIVEALRAEGFDYNDILKQMDRLSHRLTEEARRLTGNGEAFFELLPGVTETLQTLNQHERYQSALLTGNIEPMAHLKMELVELDRFFTLPGAFGSESHERRVLPALAAERIQKHLRVKLAPEQFIVIGDTPNDIDCARHFGARAVVVGTGRFYSNEELLSCKPDAFLPDLSDTNLVLKTLAEL